MRRTRTHMGRAFRGYVSSMYTREESCYSYAYERKKRALKMCR